MSVYFCTDFFYSCFEGVSVIKKIYPVGLGVIAAPGSDNAPGELGKPVVLPKNISEEAKLAVSEGWKKNAFNQYVSDLISIRRKLPDPRDEW